MYYRKYRSLLRIVAMLLVFVLTMPMDANAAVTETVQPLASSYFFSVNASVLPQGSGKVRVSFSVEGTYCLDKIGVTTIKLYDAIDGHTWYPVATYSYETTSGLMGYNNHYHSGQVDFAGVPGRYYKATVTFYGSDNGTSETYEYETERVLST